MKAKWVLLLGSLWIVGCGSPTEPAAPDNATTTSWEASLGIVDAVGPGSVLVKPTGGDAFQEWDGKKPIPGGSSIKTPINARTRIEVPEGGSLTLDAATEVELTSAHSFKIVRGQVVVAYPDNAKHAPVTVVVPHGKAVLNGTKVSFNVEESHSTATVSSGSIEATTADGAAIAVAGQEILFPAEAKPTVAHSPELGKRVGWADIEGGTLIKELEDVPRGLGKLVGNSPNGGDKEYKMELVKHRVDAKIQGNLAYTEIHESFRNPVDQTLEGIYRFPLPADARISRLSLKVGDKWMEGEFLSNDRAAAIWKDVKKPFKKVKTPEGKWVTVFRDPALLKWKEGNTFELRIFPIPAKEIREVKIGYVQRLHPSANGYTYNYPLPVDRAGLIPAERFEFSAELFGHDPSQPLAATGYEATINATATEDDRATAKIEWAEDNFIARGDFGIRYGRKDAVGLRTSTYSEKGKDPFAVFIIRPEFDVTSIPNPRDFVFVIDKSFSRSGAAQQGQLALLNSMIKEMDGGDRAAVIACNHACESVGEPGFKNGGMTASEGIEGLLSLVKFEGATYPVESVRVAQKLIERRTDKSRKSHIIYLTDGVSSMGEQRPGKLQENVRTILKDTRMSVVNAGGDIDLLAIQAMARAGRGKVFELDPGLNVTVQALDVLNAHYRAVLEEPKLTLPPGVVAEAQLPDIITAGDEVVIAARFPKTVTGEFTLTGSVNGVATKKRFPIELTATSKAKGNQFVPGEWASQRIQELELDEADHQKEIIDISVTFGVLSRYTSLLALESDKMMRQYNVQKRERTQWTGEEAAEEMVSEDAERRTVSRSKGVSGADGMSAKRSKKKSAPRASRPMAKTLDDNLDMFGSGGAVSSEPRPMPRRRPRRRRQVWVPLVAQASIKAASGTTKSERKSVQKKLDALKAEPNNRSKKMSAIRTMIRANDLQGAQTLTKEWITANPMDPEARLQLAQLHATRADLKKFYAGLIESIDAAPRGRWLQERIMKAAAAVGDEPVRCAMEVAMEATAKKPPKTPSDNLNCPMTTAVETWFGESAPVSSVKTSGSAKRGHLTIKLKSDQGDWDIMVLEPSGRPIWWGSARKGLKTANVVGSNVTEQLSLPKMRNGTYSVLAVPRNGNPGDHLTVTVSTFTESSRRVRRRGQGWSRPTTRTFKVTAPSAAPFEVAEIRKRME